MPLKGYWPLTESSGDAIDHTGNGNDGTPSGVTQGVSGILEQSASEFDGSSSSITVPHDSSLHCPTSVTTMAWVNPTANQPDDKGTIFTKNLEYYFQVEASRNISVYTYYDNAGSRGGSSYMDSNSTIPDGQWSHIAFTEDNTGYRKIYINGKVDTEGGYEASIWTDTRDLSIGSEPSGNRKFLGDITEARLYDHALSPIEIQYLYSVSQGGSLATKPK